MVQSELLELWKKYKYKNDMEALHSIQVEFRPLVISYMVTYSSSAIPHAALEAEAYRNIKKAMDAYNPSKGDIAAFVKQYMNKLYRYVNDNQNMVRMPENYKLNMTIYTDAKSSLESELGHSPTAGDISKKSGLSVKEVGKYSKMLSARGYYSDSNDSFSNTSNTDLVVDLGKNSYLDSLPPDKRKIADMVLDGKSPKEISKSTGASLSTISRVVNSMKVNIKDFYLRNYRMV